jgi:hypothetical protein
MIPQTENIETPEAAMWYLAELVMKVVVADDPRNVVQQNLVLVCAATPEQAYEKALVYGKNAEVSYDNPAGKAVQVTFEGLSNLDLIYEELEDGAEIGFHYKTSVPEEQLRNMVKPRDSLGAFLPPMRGEGPDYSSREVLALVGRKLGGRPKPRVK